MKACSWCLFAGLLFLYTSGRTYSERITRPAKCNMKGERFKHGHKYEYTYQVTTTNELTSVTAAITDSQLSCRVVVSVPRKCELILKVLDCELLDRIPNKNFVINDNSKILNKELKRHPVYLQYNEGEVISHQIVVFDSEPLHVINIKRAIVSILQLKVISHSKNERKTFPLHDIFGACQSHISATPDSDHQVETYRDLLACNLSHVSNNPSGLLSFIKSSRRSHKFSPITELTYPFELNVTCKYFVTPTLKIETADCVQRQVYNPWFTASGTRGRAALKISQHIKLESETSMLSRPVDHSLTGRVWKDLAMGFTLIEEGFTSQDVMEELEQTVVDLLGQGNKEAAAASFSAASFKTLVDKMRGASEKELRYTKETVYSCYNSSCHRQAHKAIEPKMFQLIEKKLFHDGLMSCGTNSCLAVFAASVRDGLLPDLEARSVIYNMGLFYQPSIKVVHIILEYCRKTDSQGCWLSLSAMIHRLTSAVQSNVEMDSIIFEAVSHIHHMIGDKCRRGLPDNMKLPEKTFSLEKLLMAIKAITNIGETAGHFYNEKLNNSKSLTSTLLQCVKNGQLSFIIARSAAQAVKSIGLQPDIVSQLLRVVEDEKRPLTLRTAIFDILIEHNDESTLRSLVNILDTTKMKNMQTYIMTRVSGLMENLQPEFHELGIKLGNILKDRVQPPIDDNMPFKSCYAQYSHQFTVPIMTIQTGGYLAVNLIYTPSSSVFQSFTLETGWILDNRTVHLFDIIVDLEGTDTIMEMMNRKSSTQANPTVPTNILELIDILHKYLQTASKTEIPTFAHYSSRVKLAMKEIFQLANMQKPFFPRAHLSLKVFGYEMGFISSNSLLMLMKQMHLNSDLKKEAYRVFTEGIQTILLKAFMLVDFQKVVPTVSGFHLETRIDSAVVAEMFVDLKTDMEDSIKCGKQICTNLILRPSMSSILQVNMKVSLGEYISSGISTKTSITGMGDWTGLIKYLPPRRITDLKHDMHVIWDLEQKPFNFLNIRNDRNILHNDEEYPFSQPSPHKIFNKCLPDIYTQIFGYKMCVSGDSYSVSGPRLDISSLLVNSFKVEGVLTPADNELNYYSLRLKYHKRASQLQGYNIVAQIEGPGQELSRQVSAIIDRNYNTGALDVTVDIPDAGINYNLEQMSFLKNDDYHNKYASVLSRHGKALSSFIIEKKGSQVLKVASTLGGKFMEYNETEKSNHWNISFGALSLDVSYKDHVPTPTNWVTAVTVSYHCEPKLGLLYALHPNQHLAAIQGHTSTFSYKQKTYDSKTSFYETWKGSNDMVATLPGQNITMRTDMIADLQGAHRVTDLCWEHGNKTDLFHMNSSVQNQSSTALFNFDYFLHLYSKEKFEVDIEGHVRGPRAAPLKMLNISADISFSTPGKKSKPLLSLFLSKLKNVGNVVSHETASIYEAAKSKLVSLWGGGEQTSGKEDAVAEIKENVEAMENQSMLQLFLASLNWNVAVDAQISMIPQMVSEPGGRKRKVGSEICWMVNASMPRGYNKVLLVNGSIFIGKTQSMRLQFEDYFHDLKFMFESEHSQTPKIFQHHHSWILEETNKHNFDRSFNFTFKFEYHEQFQYDLILRSPRTNVTHHINYTRISPNDHTVCAFAEVHSLKPTFDLLYHESVSVSKKGLVIDLNLTSTFLNHNFHLQKLTKPDGIVIDGTLRLLGKLPILRGEQTLSLSLALPKRRPPTSEWTYLCEDGAGMKVSISLLGPNKVTVGVKTILPNETFPQNLTYAVMWTLELVESRYLQHTIEFSPEMFKRIQNTARKLHKLAPDSVAHMGDMAVHYILADFKDKTLPLINKSVEELLKTRLREAMDNDPENNMIKLYKLTLGGINVFNTIWGDSPIVLLVKGSHIDKAMACSIKTFSNILIDWTLQPPFSISQFAKIYIQPTLQQVMKSKIVVFSTPLPFVMPSFNKMPQLTSLERAVFGLVKDRITGAANVSRDIAVILDGHTIKTFDGHIFHIAEPPLSSCTYLLGGDFKHGQFGLTYTREGVTIFTSRYGLTLARDGSIFSVNDHPISNLPFASPDGQLFISLHEGEIQLSFAEGLLDVTFNPDSDLYLIKFDRKLKNASIGLLGTNNHEGSDEFLLANGFKTISERDFQNSYELTKTKNCLVASFQAPVLCKKLDFPSCMSLSDKWPQAQPCLLVLNSQPFIDKCQKAECAGQSGCSAVRAYFAACHHQGIKVGMPAICDGHQRKSGLDLLVVQSLHHLVNRDKDPLIVFRTLLASLTHLDLSVGLITYGGAGEWKQPKLHILNGKLLEKGRKAAQYMHLTIDIGEDETEADTAVLAAAEYPFRSQASKVILLMHQRKPKQENKDKANLLEILREKGITLVSASTYPEFESSRVQGILSARDVYELGGSTLSPEDMYSDVIISTLGLWLDMDMLNSLETHKFKKLAEELARLGT